MAKRFSFPYMNPDYYYVNCRPLAARTETNQRHWLYG
jgi:hypothetical protein